MDLIVAVYDNWGIGRDGTQPIALSADRKFFREITRDCTVILGRRTLEDFPGKRPLPGRENIVLSRSGQPVPGFTLCAGVEEALKASEGKQTFAIGGGSIYRQLLPFCDRAYVTKVHADVPSDTFFPNLDESPDWSVGEVLQTGEEEGIPYEMVLYRRIVR